MAKIKRFARDPLTGKGTTVPGNMTYQEWRARNVGVAAGTKTSTKSNAPAVDAAADDAHSERKDSTSEEQSAKLTTETLRTFVSEELFEQHFKKHISEFGDITAEEYLKRANALLAAPLSDDVVQLTRSDGSVSRYCFSTNEFIVTTVDNDIKTYFKPEAKEAYWDEEIERNK